MHELATPMRNRLANLKHKIMMKLKTLLTLCAAFAIGTLGARAQDKPDTPLSKEMSTMNKTLRALKRQSADTSKKAENVAMVDKMKANVDAALKLEPAKTKEQPAGDKAAYLAKYKEQLNELKKALDELKAALNKGDADATAKAFETLAENKEKGHKDFAPDE
jgi:soluble cytochrome b562